MNKFIKIAIPVIILAASVLIMHSTYVLKAPRGEYDDVMGLIDSAYREVMSENWTQARADIRKSQTSFNIVIKRIQFSVERDEINEFHRSLARAEGFITARDKENSITELTLIKHLWDELEE